ncbi:MAG TPA: hypothetical protein VNZ52_06505, partial [Candidatus Thermoplasmatota archaeon]|nr:hypothetical protein [Candidatus Thermoplasmatota archaeon]
MAVVTLAGVAAAGVDTIYLNAEVDTPAGTVGGLPAEIMLPDTTPSVLVDGFVNNNEFVSSLITLKPRGDDAVLTLHLLPDGSLVIPLAGGLWSDSATPSTVGVAKEVDSPATLNVFVGDVRTDVDSTDYETGQAGFAKFGVGFRSETAVGDGKRLAEARAEEAQRDAAVPIKATAPGGVSF